MVRKMCMADSVAVSALWHALPEAVSVWSVTMILTAVLKFEAVFSTASSSEIHAAGALKSAKRTIGLVNFEATCFGFAAVWSIDRCG